MVGQALDALVNEDAQQTRAVIEADNHVDQIHRENYVLLSQLMADDITHVRQDTRGAGVCVSRSFAPAYATFASPRPWSPPAPCPPSLPPLPHPHDLPHTS